MSRRSSSRTPRSSNGGPPPLSARSVAPPPPTTQASQGPHLSARDKTTLKNTRDGIVQRNEATGEDIRVSNREDAFDLRGQRGNMADAPRGTGGRQLPRTGNRQSAPEQPAKRRQSYRQGKPEPPHGQSPGFNNQPPPYQAEAQPAQPTQPAQPAQSDYAQPPDANAECAPDADNAVVYPESAAPPLKPAKQDPRLNTKTQGRLKFSQGEAAPAPHGKMRQNKPRADNDAKPAPDATAIHHNRKLDKAQSGADRASRKLEKARDNLPSKKKLHSVSVTNQKTGTVRQKLRFEKTPISQGEHIKGAIPLRPVKSAANFAMVSAHGKLYQVEHENAGVKAAHRAEMLGEAGVRSALRFHKTAPYRKVARLEQTAQKKSVSLAYRKALAQNPKLKSNPLTRAFQKRKIKKDYAKAAREAQLAAKKAKKAGAATAKAGKALLGVIKRHPIAASVVILIALLIFTVMSMVGMFGGLGSGGVGGIAAGTYLAEDADIIDAQAAYAGMEADLQHKLDYYAALNPGYDEYAFDLDPIWHDPYVLIAILSAFHDGAWTLDEVQGTLAFLFERQYILTETTTTETRYRTETTTYTDPVTGSTSEVSTDVPYTYYIRTVTLENFNLSHLPIHIMGETGLSRYALMMMTLGNRPDLFPVSSFPNASYYQDYGRHDVPQAYLDADPVFAAIITEAEKWLGMPYVWGGYSPVTSFDCSGYVSWVLNQSGWDIGRLGAQGLYNISAPVSASDAKPGDLVFFTGTYDAPDPNGVTHVGIYAGDGMMVHAGNPIGYASINTAYWQNHLYAFGKVY